MLGDSIEVTFAIGAGKTDTETVKVGGVGGRVALEILNEVPAGLIYVTEYTRKGARVQRLVVSQAAFVTAVERRRGR